MIIWVGTAMTVIIAATTANIVMVIVTNLLIVFRLDLLRVLVQDRGV